MPNNTQSPSEVEARSRAGLALEELGLPVNDDMIEQMLVCARALLIYSDRERQYGSTWKQFDANDAAHHVVHKAARMDATANAHRGSGDSETIDMITNAAVDSALDAIIYAGFFVRHVEGKAS
jgi:hypothetical protein